MRKGIIILGLILIVLISSGCIGGGQTTTEVKTPATPAPTTTLAPTTTPPSTTTFPLVTFSPTTTQSSASTPTTTVPPTTAPPMEAEIKILNTYPYNGPLGYPKVVGEVENIGEENAEYIKVVSTFYDDQKQVIGSSFTYTALDILRPGRKSPFEVVLLNDISANSAKTQVEWRSTSSEPYDYYKILSHRGYVDNIGYFTVTGEIKNTGNRERNFNKIVGTFYDSNGETIATSFTYSTIDTLTPGATSPFEIHILEEGISLKIESYKLNVQS